MQGQISTELGSITIDADVIATYAGSVAIGCSGIVGMASLDMRDGLMKLLKNYLKDCVKRANNNNMKVRVIGEKSRLSEDIRNRIEELEKSSAGNTGLNFTIALN